MMGIQYCSLHRKMESQIQAKTRPETAQDVKYSRNEAVRKRHQITHTEIAFELQGITGKLKGNKASSEKLKLEVMPGSSSEEEEEL